MEFNNNLEPKTNNDQAIGSATSALKEVYLSNPSGVVKKINVDANNKLNVGSEVVATSPVVSGDTSLGTSTVAYQYLYLKDTANTDVYRLEVVSGVFQLTKI